MKAGTLLCAALAATLLVDFEIVDAQPDALADVILHNAKILTVDKDFSIADAIAIKDDRIVADPDILSDNHWSSTSQFTLWRRLTRAALLLSPIDSVIVIGHVNLATEKTTAADPNALDRRNVYTLGKIDVVANLDFGQFSFDDLNHRTYT